MVSQLSKQQSEGLGFSFLSKDLCALIHANSQSVNKQIEGYRNCHGFCLPLYALSSLPD